MRARQAGLRALSVRRRLRRQCDRTSARTACRAAEESGAAERARAFGSDGAVSALAPFSHVFTHFKLDIEPRIAELDRGAGALAALNDADTAWVAPRELDSFGVPAPVRKLLDSLRGSLI